MESCSVMNQKGWASVANLADGLTNTMDLLDDETDYGAKFFNPANDDVQNFVLQLLADLAKYDLDGIILIVVVMMTMA